MDIITNITDDYVTKVKPNPPMHKFGDTCCVMDSMSLYWSDVHINQTKYYMYLGCLYVQSFTMLQKEKFIFQFAEYECPS